MQKVDISVNIYTFNISKIKLTGAGTCIFFSTHCEDTRKSSLLLLPLTLAISLLRVS